MASNRAARHIGIAFAALSFIMPSASVEAADEPWHLDDSFGTGGEVTTHFGPGFDEIFGVTSQKDGKIVAVGTATVPGNPDADFAVVRYDPNGKRDVTFGGTGSGRVTSDFARDDDTARGVAIAPDGSIVVVGGAGDPANHGFPVGLVAVYSPLGALVSSTEIPQFTYSEADAVAIYPGGSANAGKIVVSGFARDSSGTKQFLVARFKADGKTLDSTFGNGGYETLPLNTSGDNIADAVTIQRDGKIVVAGTTDQASFSLIGDMAAIRLNPDGTPDKGFGGQGTGWVVDRKCTCAAWGVGIRADGAVYVAGQDTTSTGFDMAAWHYTSSGAFADEVTADFFGMSDVARSIVFLPGTFTLVGWTAEQGDGSSTNDLVHFALARFTFLPEAPDTTFGPNGSNKLTAAFGFGYDAALSATVTPDNDIVAAGGSNQAAPGQSDLDFALAQFTGPGSASPKFTTAFGYLNPFTFSADPASFVVKWKANGAPSGKKLTYDLRSEEARWDQAKFEPWRNLVTKGTQSTATVKVRPGRTVCFEARSHAGGQTTKWSDPMCPATPVDDRSLDHHANEWGSYKYSKCYRGTYLGTGHGHGAEAFLDAVFTSFGVLVAKGPGFGEIQVSVDGVPVRKISLEASKIFCNEFIFIKRYSSAARRDIGIKHVSTDKPVFLDGVAVNLVR